MELASRLRWALVLIAVVISLILVTWGLFSIASDVFRGGDDLEVVEPSGVFNVNSTGTARLIVDGPVVANQEHNSYVIEVSENVVSMKVYSNYGQNLVREKSYRNNEVAYSTFLSALDNLNVTERIRGTSTDDDFEEQGVCPTGRRFILEFDNDLRRWSTSCSTRQGTAGPYMPTVRTLFQEQVVDFRELVSGTGL